MDDYSFMFIAGHLVARQRKTLLAHESSLMRLKIIVVITILHVEILKRCFRIIIQITKVLLTIQE